MMTNTSNKNCQQGEHEFKKTLSRSGMYFINICQKCNEQEPYVIFEPKYVIKLGDVIKVK